MSLLTAPVVKTIIFRLEFTLNFQKTQNKLHSLSVPNFDLSGKKRKGLA